MLGEAAKTGAAAQHGRLGGRMKTWVTKPIRIEVVNVSFGPIGLIRERFALADITAARTVRNSPAYGWGMRYIPHGRLWNVWGLDAVELQLKNGTRFRIGTDQPKELLQALRRGGVRA